EKLVMVPIPILRKVRGCERKTCEMKTHPGAAMFHVAFECFTLSGGFRSRIQENDDLVLVKNFGVELGPIRGGGVTEFVFCGLDREPSVRLFHEADMRLIAPTGIKGNHFEIRFSAENWGREA